MKKLCILFFTLISLCAFAQKKDHALKVYLKDAETGKNILDARVTLEGFEIPAIDAKYDKAEKAYYFDEIPKGYNTVMAHHEKYNEKGFQNTTGLPKEVKLKLYYPYRVRIPNDSINYFKEDPYRLYVCFNDTLANSYVKCEDFNDTDLCFAQEYISKHYPDLILNSHDFHRYYLTLSHSQVFTLEKKDKKKFKRFNDPLIKKLNDDKNILTLYGILMITKNDKKAYFDEQGKPKYLPKYIRYINCDTLFPNNSIAYPVRPKVFLKLVEEANKAELKDLEDFKKNVNPNYTKEYIDYKNKIKKGILKNDIYELTAKDIDSLFISDQEKINNGELMEKLERKDPIIEDCKFYHMKIASGGPYIPGQTVLKQYKAVSNSLGNYGIDLTYSKTHTKTYGYSIDYNTKDLIKFSEKKKLIVETVKPSEEGCIYQLKNNIASPFGTTDLMEYYKLSRSKIYQQTQLIRKTK